MALNASPCNKLWSLHGDIVLHVRQPFNFMSNWFTGTLCKFLITGPQHSAVSEGFQTVRAQERRRHRPPVY